jgi:HD-GYP domain-containing protein (c-di-GMP phosphodiesterase class II)
MAKYKIKDIPDNSYFTAPVSADGGFVIAVPGIPVDDNIKKLLRKWEFYELFSAGEPVEALPAALPPLPEEESGKGVSTPQEDDAREHSGRTVETYALLSEYTKRVLNGIASGFNNNLKTVRPGSGINYLVLAGDMRELCQAILRESRHLLRIMQDKKITDGKTYQVLHAVNSLILSVLMGNDLKLNEDQLAELAVAALLHEAGMLHHPPGIYLADKPLTPEERKAILTHPILGFNMLRSLNFPPAVQLAALEHHERENGSGYPRHLNGSGISAYAKIIAVACSFETAASARPRKDVNDRRERIIDILKNEDDRYDHAAIRALIHSLSTYPVGSGVVLSGAPVHCGA